MPMQKDEGKPAGDEPVPELDSKQLIKLAIEITPIVLFALTFWRFDLLTATGVLIAATLISLAASKLLLGTVAAGGNEQHRHPHEMARLHVEAVSAFAAFDQRRLPGLRGHG